MRELVWKLAEQVFVAADARGFAEMALPGDRPGGLLRWCARVVMTTGLSDACWWVPYVALGAALGGAVCAVVTARRSLRGGALAAVVGAALAFLPVRVCNDAVWAQKESAFPMMALLGGLAACGLVAALRPWARCGGGRLLGAMALVGAAFVPLGNFALVAGAALLGYARRAGRTRFLALCGWCAIVPCACRFVYDDLGWKEAFDPSDFWVNWIRPDPAVHEIAFYRCVTQADWKGACALAERYRRAGDDFPLRAEIAFRILAQLRAGVLLEDLFRYPIRTHAAVTEAYQRRYAGEELLFAYGFLLPARREIYENVTYCGWRPTYLLRLGDVAYLEGDATLAQRDWMQLARCPFWGARAKARLACLAGAPCPEELRPVAEAAAVWTKAPKRELYAMTERVENFIYLNHLELEAGTRPMVEMQLAEMMLNDDGTRLVASLPTIRALFPEGRPWPRALQEAFVAHVTRLPQADRTAFLTSLPKGAIAPETLVRRNAFVEAWRRMDRVPTPAQKDAFRAAFGDTFWFYVWWVNPRAAMAAFNEEHRRQSDRRAR